MPMCSTLKRYLIQNSELYIESILNYSLRKSPEKQVLVLRGTDSHIHVYDIGVALRLQLEDEVLDSPSLQPLVVKDVTHRCTLNRPRLPFETME